MMVKVVRDDHEVEESVRIRFTLQESAAEPWYCNGSTRLPLFGFIRTDTLSREGARKVQLGCNNGMNGLWSVARSVAYRITDE
jgi:hypothetical protein